VFTARYALIPYIKQIRFVFKGLNISETTKFIIGFHAFKELLRRRYPRGSCNRAGLQVDTDISEKGGASVFVVMELLPSRR
jgi:hypothetical protein